MATKKTHDFAFVFSGGFPFSQQFDIANDFNLAQYTAARDKLNHGRSLLTLSRGADDVLDANVNTIMAMVKDQTKGRFDTVGQVCILGRSNGCSLGLALAAELNASGVEELTYVGMSDVTMYASGRKPPVPRFGALQPASDPIATSAKSPGFLDRKGLGGQHPAPETAIPFVNPDFDIKAKSKINHFQIKGNHMKYAKSVSRWIWWSDMADGEVHGEMNGFRNRLLDAQGNSDLNLHINLNTQQRWQTLRDEASKALATFPPEALQP